MEENKKSGLKLNGAPWYIALGCILIILASAYLGVLGTDMASVLALCVAIAVIFNEIGERLPIWNSYIGGGLLMVFFGTAVLVQFNLIPEKYVEGINTFISGDTGFLTFFIIFLIAGSILLWSATFCSNPSRDTYPPSWAVWSAPCSLEW